MLVELFVLCVFVGRLLFMLLLVWVVSVVYWWCFGVGDLVCVVSSCLCCFCGLCSGIGGDVVVDGGSGSLSVVGRSRIFLPRRWAFSWWLLDPSKCGDFGSHIYVYMYTYIHFLLGFLVSLTQNAVETPMYCLVLWSMECHVAITIC